MSINKYGGVNDLPSGFTKTDLGKKIYNLWFGMLRRCYDSNQLARKRGQSYKDVIVCNRWFYLKNFYEDIQKVDGYAEWLLSDGLSLDKDSKALEGIKIYSPETCVFISKADNMREMNKRCNTVKIAQEHSKAKYRLEKDGEVKEFDTEKDACVFLGVKQCSVAGAWRDKGTCKGWKVTRLGYSADMREESV